MLHGFTVSELSARRHDCSDGAYETGEGSFLPPAECVRAEKRLALSRGTQPRRPPLRRMESGAKELSQAAGEHALPLAAGAGAERQWGWGGVRPPLGPDVIVAEARAPTTQRDHWRFSFSRAPSRRGVAQPPMKAARVSVGGFRPWNGPCKSGCDGRGPTRQAQASFRSGFLLSRRLTNTGH
ncbi:hypothetical protein HPB52_014700 [Rhipicephalus sanguineus]|uniref:Uncharacterized protein n=1 Tax=Rhipicephalus sanguineus TaxID=34632 RepID=A0A9D4Q0E4_RHISA|nr:hypothetical protein HPB52_014700 [Rhipicephalus sanguineus]